MQGGTTLARPRRLWRRRGVKVIAGLVAVVVLAAGVSATWLGWRYRQVHRVALDKGVLQPEPKERADPQNFLIVGTDTRAFAEDADEQQSYGRPEDVGPPRADTILLARTFPDQGRVAMVSFPRDLWVRIAGTDGEERINSAIEGGPSRLIDTLGQDFGIPVHHYIQIDFKGFKSLVNAVGGVQMYFPAPVRDWDERASINPTGLDVAETGCIRLDGDTALAYVRSRHYQQFVDGEWQADPAGDLNRITRQQDFIRRTLREALANGWNDPRRIDRVLSAAIDNVQLDERLGLGDLLRLGRQFQSLSPEALQAYSLPTSPGRTAGGADVLYLDPGAAEAVLDVFRGRTNALASLTANAVRLRVLDSAGATGRVRTAAYRLAAAGFTVAGIGTSTVRARRTLVRYGPGQEGKARLLASHLATGADLVADDGLQGVDVVLLLGADWNGIVEPPVATTTTTTTTSGAIDTGDAASGSAPPATVTSTTATTPVTDRPLSEPTC